MFIGVIIATLAVVLATGNIPSISNGHPLTGVAQIIFYAVGGSVAWRFFRRTGRAVFSPLRRRDVHVIVTAIIALILVRVAVVIQLVVTNQTKHVQAGFEHYDVVAKQPSVTALSVVLAVVALVVIGPVVEEIVFRGLLFGALAPRLGTLAGALVTALVFGISHGDPVLFAALAAFGFVAALAYAATNNLAVPIVLHVVNNALGALLLITKALHPH